MNTEKPGCRGQKGLLILNENGSQANSFDVWLIHSHEQIYLRLLAEDTGGTYYMEEKKAIKRGEIYYADLDPVRGSEQGGYRPVLILQNNIGNTYSPTVIIAALTSKTKTKLPTHVKLKEMKGLEKDSVVLLEQIRTLEK